MTSSPIPADSPSPTPTMCCKDFADCGNCPRHLAVSRQQAAPGAWQPIETAPKDERLLLWFPAFGGYIASAWPGSWSWTREQWAIHTPFPGGGDRSIFAIDLPQPTHWMHQLSPPGAAADPAGEWVMVPREPTQAMLDAAIGEALGWDVYLRPSNVSHLYAAMLAARPLAAAVETDSGHVHQAGNRQSAPPGSSADLFTPGTDDEANQWLGDVMILTVLSDSDHVNEQEREVITRWIKASDGRASPAAAPMDLHAAIMNLPCKPPPLANGGEVWAYQYGHRDARHAAAELVKGETP